MSWQSVLEKTADNENAYECMQTCLAQSTPIYVGSNIVENVLIEQLDKLRPDRVFIITDDAVGSIYGGGIATSLGAYYEVHTLTFPEGETNKTIFTLSKLGNELFMRRVSKNSVIVALGGGIVGNVAGLLAALVFRGITFIEVPTTFLAQTDSIMSSKQAVNTVFGKNMLGVYYPPYCNIVDVRFLLTESARSIRSGLVETVKNGLINDATLFKYMRKKIPELSLNRLEELELLVKLSILSKIDIIKTDPSEKKRGMILEYGHTAGHAIEKLMNGALTHGECVSIGMVAAAKISEALGFLTNTHVKLHEEVLTALGMPVTLPAGMQPQDVLDTIEHDNKREADGIKYVILENIGGVKVDNGKYMIPVPYEVVKSVLNSMVP